MLTKEELYARYWGASGISSSDRMAIADDILANAPPRFALAGLSMGGYVAFEILR